MCQWAAVITTAHVLALAAIGRKTVEGDRPGVPKVWKAGRSS